MLDGIINFTRMSDSNNPRNDYGSNGDTSDFTEAVLVYTCFTAAVILLVCCICRLPAFVYYMRHRGERLREFREGRATLQQDPIEIKQEIAAAIFLNPTGSVTLGTLAKDSDTQIQLCERGEAILESGQEGGRPSA